MGVSQAIGGACKVPWREFTQQEVTRRCVKQLEHIFDDSTPLIVLGFCSILPANTGHTTTFGTIGHLLPVLQSSYPISGMLGPADMTHTYTLSLCAGCEPGDSRERHDSKLVATIEQSGRSLGRSIQKLPGLFQTDQGLNHIGLGPSAIEPRPTDRSCGRVMRVAAVTT